MNRFFVSQSQVSEGLIDIIDSIDIKHIAKVLRMRPGDRIEVSDSCEYEYLAEIISLTHNRITALVVDQKRFTGEPHLMISLFQALPKQGKMESIIQKSVELGVYKIVPFEASRSVIKDKADNSKKTERYRKITREAVKQCKRGIVPEVSSNLTFNAMLNKLSDFDLALFLYEEEDSTSIKDVLKGLKTVPGRLALIVGPEGGFLPDEAAAIVRSGAVSVSLGRTILRTETAGPAAIAMVMYELEM